MENNRILRAPDVSEETVTINSALDNKSSEIEVESADSFVKEPGAVDVESKYDSKEAESNVSDDFSESEKDKTLELAELEEFSKRLDEKEKELFSREQRLNEALEQLDSEKLSYKDSVYAKTKSEITEEVEAEYKDRIKQLGQLMQSLDEKLDESIDGAEDELVSVVYESVCKIIGSHMKESDNVISTVREVMKFTQDRMEMKLRVSEYDYRILKELKDEISLGVSNRIDIIADEHVRYGGCILETKAGRIDGRLEQQLNTLMNLLINSKA